MNHPPFTIVVVPFPYSDRLAEKRRPALVVSSSEVETQAGRLWVAMITSAVSGDAFGDVLIADLRKAGLPVRSVLRATKLATIEPERIVRTIGRLGQDDERLARLALTRCAGFVR